MFGLNPRIVESIIKQAEKIQQIGLPKESGIVHFQEIINKLKEEQKKQQKILNGKKIELLSNPKAFFPLLEEDGIKETGKTIGLLESVTIKIHRSKTTNKFIIVPSETEIEERIKDQVKLSWINAVRVAKKYVRRIHPYHEVIINFDKRAGFCKGNSLGTALTLAFIEELLKTYNSPVAVKVGEGTAFTGGMNEQGEITNTSGEIIKQKTELVFYSDINHFVVPIEEEDAASEKLEELKKDFPKRELKITGIEDLNDLLNRRNIVEIKKLNPAIRTGKFAVKHRLPISLTVIIACLIYFAGFWDLDTNPAILKNEKDWLYVQNKNGKLLWKKRMGYDITNPFYSSYPTVTQKLVDINNDGRNEILFTTESRINPDTTYPTGRVVCYNSSGSEKWEYYFRDSISSYELDHSPEYQSKIIDTVTIENQKSVAMFSHNNLYPSSVYFLRLSDGKRTGPTLWHVGHLHSGLIGDFNKDGSRELIMEGINNAFARSVILSVDIDKLETSQLPAEGSRVFKNLKFADISKYILLPQTDYDKYFGNKFNSSLAGNIGIRKELNEIYVILMEGDYYDKKGLYIQFDGNLNVTMIDPSESLEIARDSLVAQGKINPPYTHTPEFNKSLWEQLRYWEGNEFIKK